jgi:hypothetical protein
MQPKILYLLPAKTGQSHTMFTLFFTMSTQSAFLPFCVCLGFYKWVLSLVWPVNSPTSALCLNLFMARSSLAGLWNRGIWKKENLIVVTEFHLFCRDSTGLCPSRVLFLVLCHWNFSGWDAFSMLKTNAEGLLWHRVRFYLTLRLMLLHIFFCLSFAIFPNLLTYRDGDIINYFL